MNQIGKHEYSFSICESHYSVAIMGSFVWLGESLNACIHGLEVLNLFCAMAVW